MANRLPEQDAQDLLNKWVLELGTHRLVLVDTLLSTTDAQWWEGKDVAGDPVRVAEAMLICPADQRVLNAVFG